jgi:hypothetical protein
MTGFDISDTLAPNSDQLDAVELVSPRTFTIEKVSKGSDDQPVQIHLAGFPRPWRPGKSMRRVLAACWGVDASAYVGRRVTLFCDSTVVFGGQAVGGVRVSHLSHIDGTKKIPLLVSRGKSAMFTVKPLADDAPTTPAPSTDKRTSDAITHYRDTYGVTVAQLEAHVGAPSDDWSPAELAALVTLAGELQRGTKTVEGEFGEATS